MALFKRELDPKKSNTPAYREKMAEMLAGKAVRYITQRRDCNDDILGKGGALVKKEDEFIVYSSDKTIMRTKIKDMDAWILMSNDGVVITAPNLEKGGEVETITAHFVYYHE